MNAWAAAVSEPGFLRALDRLVIPRRRTAREDSGGTPGHAPRASGLDWVGHRPYQPGDDLRYLDWHLYARIGRPYVRRFVAERSERIDILIDRSRSMTVGRPPKADLACSLAFVFGYVALAAGERVGATCFAGRPLCRLPAGRGPAYRGKLLQFLASAPTADATGFDHCLTAFASRAREVGQAIVISDLLDDGIGSGLTALRERGFEVAVVRLRSSCDEEPGFEGDEAIVVDVESGTRRKISLGPGDRQRFRRLRADELNEATRFCERAGITFASLGTWRALPDLVFTDLRGAGLLD